MEFIRITDINDIRIEKSLSEFHQSFPIHELRMPESQAFIMQDKEYLYLLASENNIEVGSALIWETDEYIYLDHFFIYSDYRGQGYGSKVLNKLCQANKPVILEIDPPIDKVSINRKHFYEKNGFVTNPYKHIHPPYKKEFNPYELVIMTSHEQISEDLYNSFNSYLLEHVMGSLYI